MIGKQACKSWTVSDELIEKKKADVILPFSFIMNFNLAHNPTIQQVHAAYI
jgi:hypothetical protein